LEFKFPIQAGPGFVYATLQVKGQLLRLIVDTGTGHLILFDGSEWTRLAELRPVEMIISSNMGGDITLRQVQLKEVRLGSNDFPSLEAFLLEKSREDLPIDGLLGVRSLALSRVGFDFAKRTVSWK